SPGFPGRFRTVAPSSSSELTGIAVQ
ncbi:colicin release lysis protein, partial [Escherichia coli]